MTATSDLRTLVVCLAAVVAAPLALADYYDNFDDGQYAQDPNDPDTFDPNLWDIDNPHWSVYKLIGSIFYVDASDGWLRLYASDPIFPYSFIGAGADDGDRDPNTASAYFDDSAPHYIVTKAKIVDPNSGELFVFVHADPLHWGAYGVDLECDDNRFSAAWANGLDWSSAGAHTRNDLDEGAGFWMVCQFDGDGDPNHSWLRVAAWNGDKFDWDGAWDIERRIVAQWDPNNYGYWQEGGSGLSTLTSPYAGPNPDSDAKYDQIECRWGTFSNASHTLELTVKNAQMGMITIDPDLLDDPNNASSDPNMPTDPNELRRYTDGTEIVLVAEPLAGKSFQSWKVYDPNHPGDDAYAVQDTNSTLYLTMGADWQVQARFKCGSSEMLLPAGLVLLILAAPGKCPSRSR